MACPDRAVRSARASGALGHVGGANRPEKRVFWARFGAATGQEPPDAPKGLGIKAVLFHMFLRSMIYLIAAGASGVPREFLKERL